MRHARKKHYFISQIYIVFLAAMEALGRATELVPPKAGQGEGVLTLKKQYIFGAKSFPTAFFQ